METKKAVVIGFATLVVILTIAVLAMKAQKISYPSQSPASRTAAPASQVQPKTGNSSRAAVQADPDVKAIENDLNSVSEEDFNTNNLSDKAVGL